MISFISAMAFFLAALGFLLFAVFLHRMAKPLQRLVTEYCERRAHRALPEILKHMLDTDPRALPEE